MPAAHRWGRCCSGSWVVQYTKSPTGPVQWPVRGRAGSMQHLDFNMTPGCSSDHGHHMAFVVTWLTDIDTDPCYGRVVDPDMALNDSRAPETIMALGGSPGYSSQALPHCHGISSSTSPHSAQTTPLLFLGHLPTTYLSLWCPVGRVQAVFCLPITPVI